MSEAIAEISEIVMYDSPEAATYKTGLSGWVDRDGHFWGEDEHMARYCGSTHKKCECGNLIEKNGYCGPCRDVKMAEKFDAYPIEKWDGVTPLVVFDTDTFLFDADAVQDYLDEHEGEGVRLCKCTPSGLREVDEDYFCDDLPEDGEVPESVRVAMDALNKAIRESGTVSWWESKIAIDLEDLRSGIFRDSSPSPKGTR